MIISDEIAEELKGLIREELLEVHTSLPAEIVTYENGLAEVRPVGTRKVNDETPLEYPVISNVPVVWPRFIGDNAGVKGPVRPGDKCALQFSERALDEFLGNGGDDIRAFDLTDAIAIMGMYPTTIGQHAQNNDDMIMYFNSAFVRITAGGMIHINAPAGVLITTPDTHNTGTLTNDKDIIGKANETLTGNLSVGGAAAIAVDMVSRGTSFNDHVHPYYWTDPGGNANTGKAHD